MQFNQIITIFLKLKSFHYVTGRTKIKINNKKYTISKNGSNLLYFLHFFLNLRYFIINLTFFYTFSLDGINSTERKNTDSSINAASIHSFTDTAWIICSSIDVFHLYTNSVYKSCINSTSNLFSFYQIYTYLLIIPTINLKGSLMSYSYSKE